jgi:hypothetical protein
MPNNKEVKKMKNPMLFICIVFVCIIISIYLTYLMFITFKNKGGA